ncbi:unnamed protein product [Meganyctiphanes norvegica]|uniref:Fe2OG dioxygenase domain-containing protein n=1 Tax=Meganyctiphanes norvegica TaxID=48144 RepID=A0AAV2SMF4_MEGNR
MSQTFVKEECGANITEGKEEIEPVKSKDVEVKNEDIEIKEELIENDVSSNIEIENMNDVSSSSMEDEGTIDSNEEIEYPYVSEIRDALGVIENPGTFACGGELENARLKMIIEGIGPIKLPLNKKQGKLLKKKSTAAPFGRGSKTIVDKSIRNAWQIDAKDVTLDKAFDKLINEKVDELIPILMGESCTENIQIISELYKLVYYQKGGHFVKHRDTEKAPGMFATLVIQLPASYKGGALTVRHKGETKVFDFENDYVDYSDEELDDESDNSDTEDGNGDNFFFTAFFADCEHQLSKVTAGHRLVLIYNLICKNSTLHPNKNNIKSINKKKFMMTMKNSVEEWNSDNNGPRFLALKLDHLYTNANLSFQNLKGKDKKIANALCSCKNVAVYLATLTKNETLIGHDDDPDPWGRKPTVMKDVEAEIFYSLHNWKGLDNAEPHFDTLELHENEMLINEEFVFQKYEERSESEYEYTGNTGCEIDYFYNKKALVFWPICKKIEGLSRKRPHEQGYHSSHKSPPKKSGRSRRTFILAV